MKIFYICLVLVNGFHDLIASDSTMPSSSPANLTLFNFLNPQQRFTGNGNATDEGDCAVSVSDVSTTLGSPTASDIESAAGSRLYDDFVGITAEDDAAFSREYPNNAVDSVDLSLSEISSAAKKNSKLTSEELSVIALGILKKKETVLKKRRALSRDRSAAESLVAQTAREVQTSQTRLQEAKLKQKEMKDLESHEQGVQRKIYEAMSLLYSQIKSSSDIADEIKEEWEDAKSPGGKLTTFDSAFKSCLLL